MPARCSSGAQVLFHGTFDNLAEIAELLGVEARGADPALVYGEAVMRWGNGADTRIHGCYATLMDLGDGGLRLARSPWTPPPLTFANDNRRAIVSSSMRALAAGGVAQELDQAVLAHTLSGGKERSDAGWYKGTRTVMPGTTVFLTPGAARIERWYDPSAIRPVRFRRDEDYVEAANEQLGRAVACALAETRRPAMALSGGLDSGIVADEILRQMPAGQKLQGFTHCPHPDWHGVSPPGTFGDEREMVHAFAAMHPGLEPHFIEDPARGFDEQAIPMATATGIFFRMLQIAAPFQSVWRGAREAGCDWLFSAEWGNVTFSCGARWAPAEFLRAGRMGECLSALATIRGDVRPMWRRFAAEAVLPNLPRGMRRSLRRMVHPGGIGTADIMNILKPDAAAEAGRVSVSRHRQDVEQFELSRSHEEDVVRLFYDEMLDAGEFIQGYEQIHGLRYRDLTMYRPLMELCFGMPTDQFMRGGVNRWLARRMAVGRMPEAQRTTVLQGGHHVDWHERLTPQVPQLRARLERVAKHPWLAEWIDTDRLAALLDEWPETPSYDIAAQMPRLYSLPLAINAAEFVDWFEGRNE